jgi:L-amino acid N-acyltransferase YncA
MPDTVTLRRLGREDGARFREVRLRALQQFPENYASSYEEESVQPLSFHEEVLTQHHVLGAFEHGELIGTVVMRRYGFRHFHHKATLSAVYVEPAHQGRGIGKRLLQAIIAHAATQVEQIIIAVGANNPSGVRFYESLGFTQYGYEPRAMKRGDQYFDDIWMIRILTKDDENGTDIRDSETMAG